MDYPVECANDDTVMPLRVDIVRISRYHNAMMGNDAVNDNFSIMGEAETYTFDPRIPCEQRRETLESALQELVKGDREKRSLKTILPSTNHHSRWYHMEQNPGMYAYQIGGLLHRLDYQENFSSNYFA